MSDKVFIGDKPAGNAHGGKVLGLDASGATKNFPVASQAEAEAGDSNALMTSERTKQAIEAQFPAALSDAFATDSGSLAQQIAGMLLGSGYINLRPLTINNSTFSEDDEPGTVIGVISGRAPGSTLSIIPNDGKFAIDGSGNLVVGLVQSQDGVAEVTIRETLSGPPNSPLDTEFTLTIQPGPPINTVAPAITGSFLVGGTLTCSDGSWANSPTSIAKQWTRDGVDIPGATSANYTPVVADVDKVIDCDVDATNLAGTTTISASGQSVGVAITLGTLTLTSTTFVAGADPGTVIGAIGGRTSGGVLSVTPNDGRFAIDGSGNLVVGLSASSPGPIAISIRETLEGASNTPHDTPFTITAEFDSGVLPNLPADLNPAIWLDASDLSTIHTTGNLVNSFDNKGNRGGAATSSGSARPQSGIRSLNGLNEIDANTTQHMDFPSAWYSIPSGPYTIFIVCDSDDLSAQRYIHLGAVTGLNFGSILQQGATANRISWYLSGNGTLTTRSSVDVSGTLLTAVRGERVKGFGFINGVNNAGDNANRNNLTLTGWRLFGSPLDTANRFNGGFAEMIVFDRILSMDDQRVIEGYLAWKWGSQAKLPTSHLYYDADPRNGLKPTNLVVFGDSFTENAWLAIGDRWTTLLASLIGRQISNKGVGGETSTAIRDRELADDTTFDRIRIIWAGTNGAAAGSTVLADVQAMVNDRPTDKFIILPVINSSNETQGSAAYNNKMAVNAQLLAAYPNNFLDVRRKIIDLQALGQPLQDTAAYADDVFGAGIRADGLHLNALGVSYIPQFIADFMGDKGW